MNIHYRIPFLLLLLTSLARAESSAEQILPTTNTIATQHDHEAFMKSLINTLPSDRHVKYDGNNLHLFWKYSNQKTCTALLISVLCHAIIYCIANQDVARTNKLTDLLMVVSGTTGISLSLLCAYRLLMGDASDIPYITLNQNGLIVNKPFTIQNPGEQHFYQYKTLDWKNISKVATKSLVETDLFGDAVLKNVIEFYDVNNICCYSITLPINGDGLTIPLATLTNIIDHYHKVFGR